MIRALERGGSLGSARCLGNEDIAGRLEEVADLLEAQNANAFRVRAYRQAAETLRALPEPVSAIHARGGLEALEALPGIGESIARAIAGVLAWGRLPMLERLRGESEGAALLRTVPGIGPALAARLHDELGIETLEELEIAAHDGRLAALEGFGPKRLAAVRDTLAHRLARIRGRAPVRGPEPPVAEILEIDREYRDAAEAGTLPRIAPRRLNPERKAWLPVLHASRGERHYTALFSNTPRAHQLGRTGDWVVLYVDGSGAERQYTVVTALGRGALAGLRVVRGREPECVSYYERFGSRPEAGSGSSKSPTARTPFTSPG
jgi:predicted flap endonuclease-1-like 5' DNA nuclease